MLGKSTNESKLDYREEAKHPVQNRTTFRTHMKKMLLYAKKVKVGAEVIQVLAQTIQSMLVQVTKMRQHQTPWKT